MNLADYITHARAYLADSGSVKYSDGMLTEGIRQALWEYSKNCPHMLGSEFTVAAQTRDQVLPSLSGSSVGLQNVLEVYYPYVTGELDHNVVEGYYQYMTSGSVALNLQSIVPQVGQKFYLRYSVSHTIADLDGAAITTIRAEHDHVIIMGAVAHAVKMRASLVSESYGVRSEDMTLLDNYGNMLLGQFRERLERVRVESVNTRGPYSLNKWHLDRWDK